MSRPPDATAVSQARDEVVAQRAWLRHLRGEPDRHDATLTQRQWACLAEQATCHHLRGLTYRLLADGPLADRVPGTVRERLRSYYVDTAIRNALLLRQTGEAAAALAAERIPVLLLKGLHLARFIYPEPALRSMADVDLMVPRDRLADAERVFLDRGWGPVPRPDIEQFCTWSNHLAKLHKDGAPVVELHWSIERPTCPFTLDLDGLWARSRPALLDGVPVRLLAPEDLLLHLALHGSYHHGFDRAALKALVDVNTVVAKHRGELDWAGLAQRANSWGAGGFVYTTFRLAGKILGTPVLASVLRELRHQPADEAIVEVAERYILQPQVELPKAYLELARSRGLRERGLLVLDQVFPPRDTMERIYGLKPGTPLVYPYYLGRLLDLLARRSRLLLRSLLRTEALHPALDREDARLRIESWVKSSAARAHG